MKTRLSHSKQDSHSPTHLVKKKLHRFYRKALISQNILHRGQFAPHTFYSSCADMHNILMWKIDHFLLLFCLCSKQTNLFASSSLHRFTLTGMKLANKHLRQWSQLIFKVQELDRKTTLSLKETLSCSASVMDIVDMEHTEDDEVGNCCLRHPAEVLGEWISWQLDQNARLLTIFSCVLGTVR